MKQLTINELKYKIVNLEKLDETDAILAEIQKLTSERIARLRTFESKRNLGDFTAAELNERIEYSAMSIATGWDKIEDEKNPIGPDRVFFRFGAPPPVNQWGEQWSWNTWANRWEDGVSVYVTPRPGSMAGMELEQDNVSLWYGRGQQIGTGGDSEPVIKITGEWKKISKTMLKKIRPSK